MESNKATALNAGAIGILKQTEINESLSGARLVKRIDLRTLAPFDSISVRTLNTNYRLLLLEPESGRAIVESDRQFPKPIESTVIGSKLGRYVFKVGWLRVGSRIELCADGKYILTSPVQSLRIEHASAEWHSASENSRN
jgi:hypothetical protein